MLTTVGAVQATGPETIIGFATADIALLVSTCVALFTGISLLYVRRTFRRAGVRLKVVLHADANLWVMAGSERPVLIVEAHNSGMATVQATSLYFEVKRADALVPREYISGRVPTVIEGLHQTKWVLSPDALAPARGKKVRAIVQLAGVTRAASKWATID